MLTKPTFLNLISEIYIFSYRAALVKLLGKLLPGELAVAFGFGRATRRRDAQTFPKQNVNETHVFEFDFGNQYFFV